MNLLGECWESFECEDFDPESFEGAVSYIVITDPSTATAIVVALSSS